MKTTANSRLTHLIPTAVAVIFGCLAGSAWAQGGWDPADSDTDRLPGAFEQYYFGNLTQTATGDPGEGVLGKLFCETWNNVPNASLAEVLKSAAFREGTPATSYVDKAEATQNSGDFFLTQWRGTLTAPVTGDYRFLIVSDYQSQLWMGEAGGKFTRRSRDERGSLIA